MSTKSNPLFIKGSFPLLFLALSAIILIAAQRDQVASGLQIGDKMPLESTPMTSSSGTVHTLKELKGENGIVVVFSCNTCPFVVGSDNFAGWEGQYNALHEKAKAANMEMVLVNSNAAKRGDVDSREAMKKHAESLGYTMPYLIDANAALADAMGAKTTPHVYVFDKENTLIYMGSIDNSWDTQKTESEQYLIDVIDAVAAGNEISINSTTPRGCSIKRNK